MLGPANWGFKRLTFTGYQQTLTLADYFGGVAFGSTDEFLVVVESGQGYVVNPSTDITATTVKITNSSSPSGDTVVLIIPLVSRN